MRFSNSRSLFVCLRVSTLGLTLWAEKPAASVPKVPKKVSVITPQLGDARSGVPYHESFRGDLGALNHSDFTCKEPPEPLLPAGLVFTCDGQLPSVTGMATTDKAVQVDSKVRVTDQVGNTAVFELKFALRPVEESVLVHGHTALPKATPAEKLSSQPPDYAKVKTPEWNAIIEGQSSITGSFEPSLGPGASSLKVQVLATQDGTGQQNLLDLTDPKGAAPAAPVQQLQLRADGTYSITFAKPLAAGQTVEIQVLDGATRVISLRRAIPLAIPLARLDLTLTSAFVANASTISGKVNMPALALAPKPTATPPTEGTYPRIAVFTKDPDLGIWSQSQLTAPDGSTVLTLPVSSDGNFTVPLKTPLKSGQKVRVKAVPPFGRSFHWGPPDGPPAPPPPDEDTSQTREVESNLTLQQPSIASVLNEGAVTLNGIATPSGTAGSISVAVLRVEETTREAGAGLSEGEEDDVCLTADMLTKYTTAGSRKPVLLSGRGYLLPTTSSGSSVLLTTVGSDGGWKLTLAEALKQDDRIQIVQVLPAGTVLGEPQRGKCASSSQVVRYLFDWHRTNVTFVAGVLISNSSSSSATTANFSQANQFYAINVDRAWRLPGWDCIGKLGSELLSKRTLKAVKQYQARSLTTQEVFQGTIFGRKEYGDCYQPGWHSNHANQFPGISSFFEGRLSAIPVSTPAATPSTGGSSPNTSPTSTTTLLTSQKVFKVAAGVYYPWVLTHGAGHHPNGIFLAPLAKAGFDTITGAASTPNVLLSGGSTGTLYYQRAYNNFSFGGRLGNVELSASHERAPKVVDFLDVTVGRYSNLQSYICHQATSMNTPSILTGSTCMQDYPQAFSSGQVVESRKQLYRLDFEGLIKIPVPNTGVPFYIGFNANIAQHAVGAAGLDHGYAPPDDIRILFGTKIDIGSLLSTLSLGPH